MQHKQSTSKLVWVSNAILTLISVLTIWLTAVGTIPFVITLTFFALIGLIVVEVNRDVHEL